jgi:hypothetical protein
MLAIHVISRPGPFQDYFVRRTAIGKRKMDSVVAVGRKLLTRIFTIFKNGRPHYPILAGDGGTNSLRRLDGAYTNQPQNYVESKSTRNAGVDHATVRSDCSIPHNCELSPSILVKPSAFMRRPRPGRKPA